MTRGTLARCCKMGHTLAGHLAPPPSVAGITLLAFGNSSPDVFADLAAVQARRSCLPRGLLSATGHVPVLV